MRTAIALAIIALAVTACNVDWQSALMGALEPSTTGIRYVGRTHVPDSTVYPKHTTISMEGMPDFHCKQYSADGTVYCK